MRCSHCAGEILDGSRFCGICGRRLASATIPAAAAVSGQPAPAGDAAPESPRVTLTPVAEPGKAPLELPISRGARWARIVAVLALDVALAGAGAAMIVSVARDCEGVRRPISTSAAPDVVRAGAAGERALPEARP